ncbi:tripartite motif-containing protein 43B-like [Bos indicus]|uniref:Tripartite motif-containing protein 43B-like n=1 Tax=Bos indicus TaxID=9915 RepID=A0ABM4RSJ6_BOSIN
MDSEIPEAFQKELTCLVCLNFLLDPVTIGCGHSFCRSCLCLFWEQAKVPASCPVCRQRSEQTSFKTSFLLKNLVSTVRKANLRQFLKCEEHLCATHKQTKTIFCEADKSLLCLVCSQGQEHKTHRHCLAEEAVEESWEKLAKQMTSLWEKIQETERNLKKSSRGTDPWMELEDKLKWSESAQLHVPQPLLPELPARPMSGLMEWLNHFRVNFSLSNEVSSQHIRLFDDARRLTYEHDSLHASLDGGTLKYLASWGDQSFTSGKQYWEMLVDSSWDWAVGVCKDSWIRKDDGILDESNNDNFLLVCVKKDDHYQLWTTAPTTPLYTERPLGRVGVFLDCDSGSISFVDVAKRTLLWRYDDGVCTFPVRPFFCTGHR